MKPNKLGILAVLIALALAVVTGAQQQQLATVTVESLDILEGEEATVRVSVADVPGSGVVSFQGKITFDPTVIAMVKVEFPESCPVNAFNINVEEAVVLFAATQCAEAGGQGIKGGEIFRLIVKAVGAPGASTTLEPTFSIFHDIDFNFIDHEVVAGTITIVPKVNQLPTADFEYTPAFPSTRDTIQFLDRSFDPDGRIVKWAWEFGDGTTSDVQTPSHKYAQGGAYTVKLTVTDNRDGSAQVSKRIYVFPAPPPNAAAVINFPNPARTYTVFLYFLPEGTTQARLLVFNLKGALVFEVALDVTRREFRWDLRDNRGNDLPNGPYFYLVRAVTPAGVISSPVEVLVIQR